MKSEVADPEGRVVEAGPTLRPVQARQGVTLGRMRYVLAISLALTIAAFAVIYFVIY